MPLRAALFGILLYPTVVLAYDVDRARTNLAQDYAECAAFFKILSEAPGLGEQKKQKALVAGTYFIELSARLTSEKLAFARLELSLKEFTQEIDGSWENISILLNKYGDLCNDLRETPKDRLRYWLDKQD